MWISTRSGSTRSAGILDDWVAANPLATFEISTPGGIVTLAAVNEHGSGPTWLNLDITPEEDVLLDTVILGDSVRIDVHAN